MRSVDIRKELSIVEEPTEEEEDEADYTDDDFWEAIDLLQTAQRSISMTLKYHGEAIHGARKRLLDNLTVDIQQFVDFFVDEESEDEE